MGQKCMTKLKRCCREKSPKYLKILKKIFAATPEKSSHPTKKSRRQKEKKLVRIHSQVSKHCPDLQEFLETNQPTLEIITSQLVTVVKTTKNYERIVVSLLVMEILIGSVEKFTQTGPLKLKGARWGGSKGY